MEGQAKVELHKAVAAQLKRQLQVQERLAQGKPFGEILRIAREDTVDLIVIPTRSKPDPKHTLHQDGLEFGFFNRFGEAFSRACVDGVRSRNSSRTAGPEGRPRLGVVNGLPR